MSNNVSSLKLKKPSRVISKLFDGSDFDSETAVLTSKLRLRKPFNAVSEVFDASVATTASAGKPGLKLRRPSAVSAQLDNRGATFPSDQVEEKVVKSLKLGVASRWKLKHQVVSLLRKNPKPDGSTYAVCGCGYSGVSKCEDGSLTNFDRVSIHRNGSKVSVSGALRCNSSWMCPSCAPGRAKARQEKVQEVIEKTSKKGGNVGFVTLTISHKKGETLENIKAIQSEASRRARQGRGWVELKDEAQILGVVQGSEVLENIRTGWHFHSHLLVPCMGTVPEVQQSLKKFVQRYIAIVRELGGKASMQGQDIQIIDTNAMATGSDVDLSHYVTKGSSSWEIAGSLKEARSSKSRTPWDLATLAGAGDKEAEALFVEYANCMIGSRSCVVSAALAKKLEIEASVNDDEVPSTEKEETEKSDNEDKVKEEFILPILAESWKKLMSYGYAHRVIEAVEVGKSLDECNDVVFNFIDEIKIRERKLEDENIRKDRERRTEHVSVFDVLYYVNEYRRLGMNVNSAKIKAVRYLKDFHRKSGRIVIMPSDVDIDKVLLAA